MGQWHARGAKHVQFVNEEEGGRPISKLVCLRTFVFDGGATLFRRNSVLHCC